MEYYGQAMHIASDLNLPYHPDLPRLPVEPELVRIPAGPFLMGSADTTRTPPRRKAPTHRPPPRPTTSAATPSPTPSTPPSSTPRATSLPTTGTTAASPRGWTTIPSSTSPGTTPRPTALAPPAGPAGPTACPPRPSGKRPPAAPTAASTPGATTGTQTAATALERWPRRHHARRPVLARRRQPLRLRRHGRQRLGMDAIHAVQGRPYPYDPDDGREDPKAGRSPGCCGAGRSLDYSGGRALRLPRQALSGRLERHRRVSGGGGSRLYLWPLTL